MVILLSIVMVTGGNVDRFTLGVLVSLILTFLTMLSFVALGYFMMVIA